MIYGKEIRLRHNEASDLDRYAEWVNDPEVRSGLELFLPLSVDEEKACYDATLERDPRERRYAIDLRLGDDWIHIGGCALFDFDHNSRKAELGIMIGDESRWGHGIGQDAMLTLLRLAFATLNLNRVFLRVYEFNERAMGLYRKFGFSEEGRLRQDVYYEGVYRDRILMGILRDEWDELSESRD
jgi:RimJ/RimL family protein N-acetyltransferase